MRTIFFYIEKSLLIFILAILPYYATAQITFSNSEDDIKVKKYIPVTDGTINMVRPHVEIEKGVEYSWSIPAHHVNKKNGVAYDWTIPAQIEFYKAFIGQKILFYDIYLLRSYNDNISYFDSNKSKLICARLAKQEVIDLPDNTNFNGPGANIASKIIHKLSTHIPYAKNASWDIYSECDAISVKRFTVSNDYIIIDSKISGELDVDMFKQFFLIKDVLSWEEAEKMLQGDIDNQAKVRPPKFQKRWEKLDKKRAEGKLTKYDEKEEYERLQNKRLYYPITINEETVYSLTIKGDTLIDNNQVYEEPTVPIVLLVEDNNGTEYLLYKYEYSDVGYITENRLNYLKEQYIGQDFSRIDSFSGRPTGDVLRCDELVIRDNELMAKCHVHGSNKVRYLSLFENNGFRLSDEIYSYEIIVL